MSTKHSMIPLVALLPLGLVACDESVGTNEGTDASTFGGADAGTGGAGPGFFGGDSGSRGGGGLFGGRGDSEAPSTGGGSTGDEGTGGGSTGGDDPGYVEYGFPDVEPGDNIAAAEALFEEFIEQYCELAAPCYGYSVEECVEYYTNSDYFGEYIDLFSNAPVECLDALRAYTECDASFQECVDGELVSDYYAAEAACYDLSVAQEGSCAAFFEEFFGAYYYDDYGYDDYGYEDPTDPIPDGDGDFFCDGGSTVIPLDWVCNGQEECFDGTDEEGC